MVVSGSKCWWVTLGLTSCLLATLGAVAQETEAKAKTKTVSPVVIKPKPRKITPGSPLSVRTLVLRPLQIPNVLSWTIESKRHRGYLITTAISPDDKQIATGVLDGIIRIEDRQSPFGN